MRRKERVLAFLLAGIIGTAAAAGCGAAEPGSTKTITQSDDGNAAGIAETSGTTAEASDDVRTGENTEESDTMIEEQVLLDAENVKITAVSYEEDAVWGDGIKLLIENNGSASVGVGSKATIVNNYMITDLFSSTVAPGKKAYDTLYLTSPELKAAGIDNVGQVEIYFYLFDADTYATTYEADSVTVKTSRYDVMDTTPNDDGQELYQADGIRIVGKYVDEDSIWGNAIVLYLENDTDQNVTIQCDDLSVNGFMMTPFFSCDLYAGKMAISDITLLSSELEENGISSVDDVELKFKIINPDTYETIRETGPITFSAK